tara:strand:+ start:134 stop:733 length:600 start_codon:yes stop_codon:yes gene_type:complete
MGKRKKYLVVKNAISSEICDEIIKIGEKLHQDDARAGDYQINPDIRKSKVSWIELYDMPSIEESIMSIVEEVNDKHSWGYVIDEEIPYSAAQYTVYDKDDYYDWHTDTGTIAEIDETSEYDKESPDRVISITLLLSNYGDDYTGGEFEILPNIKTSEGVERFKFSKGDMIVFKSVLGHRVLPVISGQRKSLVMWFLRKK